MSTAVYFFTTLHGCCLFLIVIWTSMFVFFTTLDECCLLLIVTWPSLFIFFQLRMGAVFYLIVIWASPGFFFTTLDGYRFFPIPHLQHKCGMAWTPASQAIHIVQCTGYVNCKCVTLYCAWAPLPGGRTHVKTNQKKEGGNATTTHGKEAHSCKQPCCAPKSGEEATPTTDIFLLYNYSSLLYKHFPLVYPTR